MRVPPGRTRQGSLRLPSPRGAGTTRGPPFGHEPDGLHPLLERCGACQLLPDAGRTVALGPENKVRRPEPEALSLRVVYMSGEAFTEGVETHEVEGVAVKAYSAPKTVADCFKYRSRVGLDVAMEALKDYRRSTHFDADALWRFAKVCRVAKVMRPYLETVA